MNNSRQKELEGNSYRICIEEIVHWNAFVAMQVPDQTTASTAATNSSVNTATSTQTNAEQQTNNPQPSAADPLLENRTENIPPTNPCVLCLTEEKRLACIPCGHLATCVPCGHSLRSCPICRREIEAFVRIFI